MFGSSSSKDGVGSSSVGSSTGSAATSSAVLEGGVSSAGEPTETSESTSALTNASSNEEENGPTDEKKNRSSGVTKASSFLSNAKNSFHLHGPSSSSPTKDSHAPQSPLQKLGKSDPALSVPQGANNNSAGESHPGPRSTFHVGVTEDKNKKCRRTMEDTHSYLYNFLSTPAPALDSLTKSASRSSVETPLPPTGSNISGASKADLTETDNGYFAIFDGHAGTFAADWCGKKLHIILEEAIRKQPNTPIPELLDQSFTSADQQLEKLPLKNSGCTAVTAVLRWEDRIPNAQSATGSSGLAPATVVAVQSINAAHRSGEGVENSAESTGRKTSTSHNKIEAGAAAIAPPLTTTASTAQVKLMDAASRQRVLYTANVGDARIVLCRNGKALRLSYDHKGSDENEGRRISNAGGLILNNRVNGVLAVTRALGDAYMKDLVTGHPYTTETVVQPEVDEFLILACDGLWDVCSDQEAVDHVRSTKDPQVASKMLVGHALARFSTDNLSCMVVRFDTKAVQQAVAQQTDLIGVEGDSPSKKGSVTESEAIVAEAQQKIRISEGESQSPSRVVEELNTGAAPGPKLNPEG